MASPQVRIASRTLFSVKAADSPRLGSLCLDSKAGGTGQGLHPSRESYAALGDED
ncbi:hypothetical protein ABZ835_43605 [Streptomyces sp. NPDC047461]|uniref:hypothetical protein n=1 Tax=Streptomyces sp. NPDC047461 TaxID=3155619 RepID=UPI0033C5BADE